MIAWVGKAEIRFKLTFGWWILIIWWLDFCQTTQSIWKLKYKISRTQKFVVSLTYATACKQKKKMATGAEDISFSYKEFVIKLEEKCVLKQFQKGIVNRIPKIIDETIGQKLRWDSDSTQEKVCSSF